MDSLLQSEEGTLAESPILQPTREHLLYTPLRLRGSGDWSIKDSLKETSLLTTVDNCQDKNKVP
jgi:hypothetical protein